ncbi:MAG TPA: cupin-like domain-containing protein, partial [Kofleriaceae bacterium]
MTGSILHQLIGCDDEQAFFADHWPSRPMVRHGALDRLAFAARIPEVHELARLARRWSGRIMAWPRAGSGMPTLEATPDQAEALYAVGYTLFFSSVERQVPSVRSLAAEFATAMGASRDEVSCEVFYSHRGSGAAAHFDPHAGFNIQLVGSKTWRMAPNQHVEFPLVGGVMGARPDARLLDHARLPFPREMPCDAETVSTEAGSVVFVPGGYWHTTEVTSEHSVAIVLTVRPRSWCQRLVGEIEKRLHEQLASSRAASLPSRADRFAENQEILDDLLGAVIAVVSSMNPRGLLKAWAVAAQPVLSVPPGVQVQVDEAPGAEWGLSVRQRDKQFGAKIDRSLGSVLKTISSHEREVPYNELCRLLP